MPVILRPECEQKWISEETGPDEAGQLLLPLDQNELSAYTISPRISARDANPDDPEIISPFDYPLPGSLF